MRRRSGEWSRFINLECSNGNGHWPLRLPEPIPMERFRPNLVLEGLPPSAEDRIASLRIGNIPVLLPCVPHSVVGVLPPTPAALAEPVESVDQFYAIDVLGVLVPDLSFHAQP